MDFTQFTNINICLLTVEDLHRHPKKSVVEPIDKSMLVDDPLHGLVKILYYVCLGVMRHVKHEELAQSVTI